MALWIELDDDKMINLDRVDEFYKEDLKTTDTYYIKFQLPCDEHPVSMSFHSAKQRDEYYENLKKSLYSIDLKTEFQLDEERSKAILKQSVLQIQKDKKMTEYAKIWLESEVSEKK